MRDGLGFHPLLIEDIRSESHPKVEEHDAHVYMILHGLHPDRLSPDDLQTVELDVVLSSRWLLTHQAQPVRAILRTRARLAADPSLLRRGPAHVAHALIDEMTDRYLPLMEAYATSLDELEMSILQNHGTGALPRILALKHGLLQVRRIGFHQRAILRRLAEGRVRFVPSELTVFFRDVEDHFVRAMDLGEAFRDQLASAMDASLSMQSYRMNEIMKVLTIMSTVMLP
ncbi:MAG: magnesium transporter CorA family protein, partial [Myxococcales bacterium]|nr:magnesium transporter CorA family protein [Myxococcales bacterium]